MKGEEDDKMVQNNSSNSKLVQKRNREGRRKAELTTRFSRKSMPTVVMNLGLNLLSVYRYRKVVFPTPESPRARSFIR